MLCFICQSLFNSADALIAHLKKKHYLNTLSTFRCTNCIQSFQNLTSFKRHLNRKHQSHLSFKKDANSDTNEKKTISTSTSESITSPQIVNTVQIINNIQNKSCQSCTQAEFPSLQLLDNIATDNDEQNTFNFEEDYKDFINSVENLLLSWHNNNNFSRKDVYGIADAIKEILLSPLLNIFQKFANQNFKNDLSTYNGFLHVIHKLRNLFNFGSSDYLFTQWLKKTINYNQSKNSQLIKESVEFIAPDLSNIRKIKLQAH